MVSRFGKYIFTACLAVAASATGQTLQLDDGFRSSSYDMIRRLKNQGHLGNLFENSRPYDLRGLFRDPSDSTDVRFSLSATASPYDRRMHDYIRQISESSFSPTSRPHIWFDLASRGSLADGDDARSYESFSGRMFWRPQPRFSVYTSFSFDETLAHDTTFTGKVWSGVAGKIDYAYLQFDLSYIKLYFGRDKAAWGPGRRGNLLMSANSASMDMLKLVGSWGPVQYTAITAVLDPYSTSVSYVDTTVELRINRYLSAHRFEVRPHRSLTLGFSESVIYGGVGRQIELYYTNPLTWYHGEQLNKDNDDNTFLAIDFTFYPKRGISLYGEFLVDDFQIEKKSKGDDEPNELGYMFGLYLTDPIPVSGLDLSVEYTRINNRTYNQGLNWNRYLYDGKIIGHFLGPDRESIYFSIRKWFLWDGWATLSYERQNIGEGNVFDDWTRPWLFSTGAYQEDFPTGTVEKRDIIGVSFRLYSIDWIHIDIDNFYTSVKNNGNILGESDSFYEGRLTATASIPIL
jgi:hypothetical protein